MDLIRWEEKYSVGVREIDNQHQQLFTLLNNFNYTILRQIALSHH